MASEQWRPPGCVDAGKHIVSSEPLSTPIINPPPALANEHEAVTNVYQENSDIKGARTEQPSGAPPPPVAKSNVLAATHSLILQNPPAVPSPILNSIADSSS